MASDDLYLGTGVKLPAELINGDVAYTSGAMLVVQSCLVILDTVYGQSFIDPSRGCSVNRLLFDQATQSAPLEAEYDARRALNAQEPRCEVISTSSYYISPAECALRISIRILSTDEIVSFNYSQGQRNADAAVQ